MGVLCKGMLKHVEIWFHKLVRSLIWPRSFCSDITLFPTLRLHSSKIGSPNTNLGFQDLVTLLLKWTIRAMAGISKELMIRRIGDFTWFDGAIVETPEHHRRRVNVPFPEGLLRRNRETDLNPVKEFKVETQWNSPKADISEFFREGVQDISCYGFPYVCKTYH